MRILAVKLSSLGDLFHILPTVHELKKQLGAEIDLVTQSEYVGLAACFPDISRIIAFPRRRFFREAWRFRRELQSVKYDLVVDFQGLFKSAIVTILACSRRRIGPSFNREGARLFYTETAGARNKNRHAVDENMDILRHLNLCMSAPVFNVRFPAREISGPRPRVAIAPVSRWHTKTWPAERFGMVARNLTEECGASIYLLGGAGDVAACDVIRQVTSNRAISFAGSCTLPETGGILKEMDLLISNDSGLVHMAVAAGVPTVVIFGPTNPLRTGPYGGGHSIVSAGLDCQPCMSRRCRYDSVRCLESVTVDMVTAKALETLRG